MNTQQQQDLARILALDEQRTQGEWRYITEQCRSSETGKMLAEKHHIVQAKPDMLAWVIGNNEANDADFLSCAALMAALLRTLSAENAALRAGQEIRAADASEKIATEVYEAMRWAIMRAPYHDETPPKWTPGGNSNAQSRARDAARSILALPAAPAQATAGE